MLLDALAVSFDLPILDWIAANLWCPILDTIMPIITMFGDGGIFWIAISVILMITKKYRKPGLGMAFAWLWVYWCATSFSSPVLPGSVPMISK